MNLRWMVQEGGRNNWNINKYYFYALDKFVLTEIAGVRRIRRKRDNGIMTEIDKFPNSIHDIHVAGGHKGRDAKGTKKQRNTTPSMAAVNNLIVNCKKKGVLHGLELPWATASGPYRLTEFIRWWTVVSTFFITKTTWLSFDFIDHCELLHIFFTFVSSNVRQSDSGRKFTAGIVTELALSWPRPHRRPQE